MSAHQPSGYPAVSPYIMADGAQRVIDFVQDVLGGDVMMRIDRDDGSLLHGALSIGDSVIMLSEATKDFAAFPIWLHVYVPDVDATYRRALEKGASSVQEPKEQGDGDRRAGVADRAGNTWWLATHVGR
jgi:PhnB protein